MMDDPHNNLLNHITDLAWIVDTAGVVSWFNRQWLDFTGLPDVTRPNAQLHGSLLLSAYAPEEIECVRAGIAQTMSTGDTFEKDLPLRRSDGEVRWFHCRFVPVCDSRGTVMKCLGIHTDVHDSWIKERELRRCREQLNVSTSLGKIGLAEIDCVTDSVELTSTAARIYGLAGTSTSLSSSEWRTLVHPDDWPCVEAALQAAREGAHAGLVQCQHRILSATAQIRWLSFCLQYFFDADKQPIRGILAVQDITHAAFRERELADTKQQAFAAQRAKSDFLANMNHEIRSPLAAILGYADLLRPATESDVVMLEMIRRNSKFLLNILNDVLDLSRIEAGEMDCTSLEFSPVTLTHEVMDLLRPAAEEKELTFDVVYETRFPTAMYSDPVKLRQVLINLLDNAIKFTSQGSVRLICRYEPEKSVMTFSVRDTGIGVRNDYQVRLFNIFEQADNSNERKYGGTGLGLAISQRFAELLGGTIDFSSNSGQGSTFRLTLRNVVLSATDSVDGASPTASQSATHSTQHQSSTENCGPTESLLPLNVLVVDDRRDIRMLTSRFIETWGGSATQAENGAQALSMLQKSPGSTGPFDAVLMDLQMPELDGLSAVRAMRKAGHQLPVIAMTANSMESARQDCLKAGYSDYLSKPVDFVKLKQLLAKLCQGH